MREDPFAILELPAAFDLSPAVIRRAYLAKVTALHPDAAVGAGVDPAGDPRAARINAAKQALEDPERRAEALLTRLGGPAKEADRSLPDGFLAAMLEEREQAEEARSAGDAGALAEFVARAHATREAHIRQVGRLFASIAGETGKADKGGPGADVLKAVRRELNAWRYVERMIEQLEAEGDR